VYCEPKSRMRICSNIRKSFKEAKTFASEKCFLAVRNSLINPKC
jgi:hypothetical protein